jgi:uncharacterized protein (TIGR03435 family)
MRAPPLRHFIRFTAVQEQLGMKLQREEVPRELFVIEKVSELIPN